MTTDSAPAAALTTPTQARAATPAALARRAALYFVLGAVVGTLGDRVHTYTGVLSYPRPVLFDEAWWVPLLMGGAGVAMTASYPPWARFFNEARSGGSLREVLTALVWFGGFYASSGVFKAYPVALTVLFVGAFVARALRAPVSRAAWVHALGTAAVGTAVEATLCAVGAFRYHVPDVLGVPVWLPGLYLHAALLARAVDRHAGA